MYTCHSRNNSYINESLHMCAHWCALVLKYSITPLDITRTSAALHVMVTHSTMFNPLWGRKQVPHLPHISRSDHLSLLFVPACRPCSTGPTSHVQCYLTTFSTTGWCFKDSNTGTNTYMVNYCTGQKMDGAVPRITVRTCSSYEELG